MIRKVDEKARVQSKDPIIKKTEALEAVAALRALAAGLRMSDMSVAGLIVDDAATTLRGFVVQESRSRGYALFRLTGPDGGGRAAVFLVAALIASIWYASAGEGSALLLAIGLVIAAELASLVRIGELRRCEDERALEAGVRAAVFDELEAAASRCRRGDQGLPARQPEV